MIVLAARALLGIGSLMVVGSLLMLLITQPGTKEQVISQVCLLLGSVLLVLSAIAIAHGRRIGSDRASSSHKVESTNNNVVKL